ncbi:hypothetical protein [Deinococcus roseus]|uniref:MalT-like TPR region domain-containing protein n=1 Tax=Deinococcus roseus TaxID=392414 RepID=A0ABQ2CU72_9DEIO|nr:hypothetical protein [Deinococcus roseus]GGJ21052.1 hypothetical protein GCM10008938_04090 [Deinococcus roseus]
MSDLARLFPELHPLQNQFQAQQQDPALAPEEAEKLAVLAWQSGLVNLTVLLCEKAGSQMNLLKAIALNRQGNPEAALEVLQGLSGSLSLIHQGSSLWQLGKLDEALEVTTEGLQQARKERNGSAIISGVCISGEVLLDLQQHKPAVVALAEAFKVAELINQEADPYALAITAEAHIRWGHARKALATTEKVFSRTRPHELGHFRAKVTLSKLQPEVLPEALQVAEVLGWGYWVKRLTP